MPATRSPLSDQRRRKGTIEVDARGLAVAPGFINMLSWATESLIADGRSQSDIRQGVTLEVFGEGVSMGPLSDAMKKNMREHQGDIKYEIEWTTLAEYLAYLERKGVSCNVASFVGATTVRVHEVGYDDRPPTPDELERMCQLVRQAMQDGALGVGSSLIYAPAFYAETDELAALTQAAQPYGGMYISHLRSEAAHFLEAVDELITHRATRERAGRDLSPQGRGQRELAEVRRRHPADRSRARRRPAHHGRHVSVHRRLHRPRCQHAAVGSGGRS